jgi:hypothetical protein
MPDPTVSDGHVDQLLTDLSVSFMQSAEVFIADKVFPVVPVAKKSDRYRVYPRAYFAMDNVGPRPIGGYPRRSGYRLSSDSYNAEEEATEGVIDDQERANWTPPGDPEQSLVNRLTEEHLIHRDRAWASAYFRSGVWGTDFTGVAAAPGAGEFLQWNDAASDPLGQVDDDKITAALNGGFALRTLVLGAVTYIRLKNHPDVIARLANTATRIVTRQVLAALFDVDEVLVPMGVVNNGPEKETVAATEAAADYQFICGAKDALLVYSAPQPGLDRPSGGYIFAWDGLLGNGSFSLSAVNRGRDDRAYSDWFHVRQANDMKVVAPDLGIFYEDAVA